MKPEHFIREYGVEKARKVIDGAPAICTYFEEYPLGVRYYRSDIGFNRAIKISDLKRLVQSVDLVKRYGGIAEVKTLHQDEFWNERVFERLKQSIADYEQLFGNTETLELETLRDCDTSPNCKKFDEGVK